MTNLLDTIEYPSDLKKLHLASLPDLVEELREFIIEHVSQTGGHLAPTLGVVELTTALHYVFDTPKDKIVWDVGHQAYIHKILTGRKNRFDTLRQYGGISGFPKREESDYDVFNVGHSSTSLSSALGIAIARDKKGEDFSVIPVIGDGALTGGMALEALNQIGYLRPDMLLILNDNKMSISPNVGAISNYLAKIITDPAYNRFRNEVWEILGKLPAGSKFRGLGSRLEESLKNLIMPGGLFEELGIRYIGPVDGHNVTLLVKTLRNIKDISGPILLHVVTKKGKGYRHAEEDAVRFHGLGCFDKVTGKSSKVKPNKTYSKIFGEALSKLAKKDERIIAITAAMPSGTGLDIFAKELPEQFFDVGIAEQHAVTFAAGMATQGMKPVAAIYSTFLQRAFDQVIHDVCLQKLPVAFCLDRGGLVGEDGPTHHGVFDLSYLRMIPNLIVMAPKNGEELCRMLRTQLELDVPSAMRYPRGCIPDEVEVIRNFDPIPIGTAEVLKSGKKVAVLAICDMVYRAKDVIEKLAEEKINVTFVNARFVKPLDEELLKKLVEDHKILITLENNVLKGGFGSAISEWLLENDIHDVELERIGIPDEFIEHGDTEKLLEICHMDEAAIEEKIRSAYERA